MTSDGAADRPTIEEVVKYFVRIRASLSTSNLRSAITLKNDPATVTALRHATQFFRILLHIARERAATLLP